MGAVRALTRFEIRRRWRRLVLLTLLVAVVGAAVLSTVAGARRSASALARFNASSGAGNLELTVGDPSEAQLHAFGAVPNVAAVAPLRGLALAFPRVPQLSAIASARDDRFGRVVDRARLVAGRAARRTSANEVTIGEALAAQLHLHVGDHLDAVSYTPEQVGHFLTGDTSEYGSPMGPNVRLGIVGIVRRPLDLGDRGASGGVLVLPPGFNTRYADRVGSFGGTVLRVRTVHGAADVGSVAAAARRIFGRSPQFDLQDLAIETQGASSAIDALMVALWVFAGIAAFAGVVAIAVVVSRELSLTALDHATQSALGVTRRQRVAIGGLQVVPVALVGGILAVAGAAAGSPLFPIGLARRAEPAPGFHVDGIVLALGAAGVIVAVLAIAFVAALRTTRRRGIEHPAPGPMTALLAATSRAGAPPAATTGIRMALEPGRGATTVPVRSAMFGAVVGIVGVVAILIVATSLDRLVATPVRYGWTWDFAAVPDDPTVVGRRSPVLRVPGVSALSEVDTVSVQLDGRPVTAWGFRSIRGAIGPEIVSGRAPHGRDEIALGAGTLGELHERIGGTVRAQGPDGRHSYRIVGQVVLPKLDEPQPLANGAVLSAEGLRLVLNPKNSDNGSPYLVARASPGISMTIVEHRVGSIPRVETPFGPTVPAEVDHLRQAKWLPASLVALLGFLALFAVGHALFTNVRRRRRDFAVLKTLGFDRSHVRATVAWQATTLAALGVALGVPLGIIIGDVVWRLIAHSLGVATTAAVPILAIVVATVGAVAILNVVAIVPARIAARARLAVALRSE